MIAEEMYEKLRAELTSDLFVHFPYLRNVAKGNILEIGVEWGASTSAFVLGLEENDPGGHIYSVDINPRCGTIPLAGHPQWTFINENSRKKDAVLAHIPTGTRIDVLFIDGDHDFDACYADLVNYAPLVKLGGLILVHDVRPGDTVSFPGVRAAFEIFEKQTGWTSEVRPNWKSVV